MVSIRGESSPKIMKNDLIRILKTVLKQVGEENGIDFSNKKVSIQENKEKSHGDYASNLAMVIAKDLSQTPREVAEKICSLLPSEEWIEKVNIAGPGFINFYLKKDTHNEILLLIEESGRDFGRNNSGNGERVLIEYVSSNPTGPLHWDTAEELLLDPLFLSSYGVQAIK